MILKRLVTHNYRQHGDLDINLEGTLIAVVGPNGSGKTNLLGSIQYALTGEQSGYDKADLLAWGSDDGYVTLYFEHDGTDGVVTRNIHNSGCTFRFGNDTYPTAAKTAEALRVHLQLDKGLADQAVFVAQAKLDAILFTDPRIRELAFQKLMGIGDASKIYDTLGKVLSAMDEPPNFDEQIAEGKARWAEMHTRMVGLQQQLQQLQAQRQQAPSVMQIKQSIEALRQTQQRATSITQFLQQEKQLQHDYDGEVLSADVASQHMCVPLEQIDTSLAALKVEWLNATNYKSALAAWEAAGQAVLDLGQPPYSAADVEYVRTNYDTMTGVINQQLGQHKLHADMLKALQGAGYMEECPVCGSPIADESTLKRRLQEIIARIEKTGAELRAEQAKRKQVMDERVNAVAMFDSRYRMAVGAYNNADTRLKSLPVSAGDPAQLQTAIDKWEAERRKHVDAASTQRACIAKAQVIEKQLQQVRANLAALRTVWDSSNAGAVFEKCAEAAQAASAQIPALEQQRDNLSQIDAELARLGGAVTELQAAMDSLDKTVAGLEFKRGTHQTLRDALLVLTRVRDWFHYKNGPHTLSAGVLQIMNEKVNHFLSQFSAPFTVEPAGDTLGFVCYFTDGRPMPKNGPPDASVLSGGQKIQLAVAFRFAAYCMFAAKLGLLSLDEPTVYLDDENVGRFGDLLQQVKQIAHGMNLQVLIATHERSVIPFCDTVIDLGGQDTPTPTL